MITPNFCCVSLSKMYGHDWKRSCPKGNGSALPLMAVFVHHEDTVLWLMLVSLLKASVREWDSPSDVTSYVA